MFTAIVYRKNTDESVENPTKKKNKRIRKRNMARGKCLAVPDRNRRGARGYQKVCQKERLVLTVATAWRRL